MPVVYFSVVLPLFLFLVMHGSVGLALICRMRQLNIPPLQQHWPYHKFPSSGPLDLFRRLRLAVFLLPLCNSSNIRSDGRHPLSPWVFWEGAHGRRCMADIVPCHSFKTLVSRILSRLDTINCLTRLTWPANQITHFLPIFHSPNPTKRKYPSLPALLQKVRHPNRLTLALTIRLLLSIFLQTHGRQEMPILLCILPLQSYRRPPRLPSPLMSFLLHLPICTLQIMPCSPGKVIFICPRLLQTII